ncbi:MAG TPA: sulfatase-like hydrolase/transferase [Acidobacteriota bacterium]|nr:sulfatase-like hydrolase/transferase [Acidobacteriota bacterium]
MKDSPTDRRHFLKTASLAASSAMISTTPLLGASASVSRPNLLVIMTDQQFADAMSCVIGRRYIHTPHMDSLAATGMRFTRAYSANPLCVPARSSLFTGRFPHETGIQTNTSIKVDPERFPCMGRIFQAAGYETGFFGKWHMPFVKSRKEEHGFEVCIEGPCLYNGEPAAEFIRNRRDRPFLAVASFMNPHDICQWARGDELPGGPIGEPPEPDQCPPLKANALPPKNETDIMAHMRRAYQAHRLFPVGGFTDDKWRQMIWAYYRLVEKVDEQVGTVLEALRESGQEENTVVLFLSDHGECHGAHRWNQKTVFYDESSRVPLIIRQKGTTPTGTCDSLVHTGVDLIPTLCDFASLPIPDQLPGQSLRRDALGQANTRQRRFLVISNHMVQCEPVDGVLLQPEGRMVRSEQYKYCLYSLGERRESLVDMERDPGEMENLAGDPSARQILLQHREYLRSFAKKHGDQTALAMLSQL